ncbi:MAG: hypothetical protein LBC43_00540 [Bifidobacteriaceae bacterium]|nr:hypothetical protein [Bifidobacteriaceae bacterium]
MIHSRRAGESEPKVGFPIIYPILIISALAVAFFSLPFSPLYNEPFNPDVSFYMTVGKGWLENVVPYRDILDPKGPVIFIIFGILQFLSANSFWLVFLMMVGVYFITGLFLYKIANLWYSRKVALVISIFALAFLVSLPWATNQRASLSAEMIFSLLMFIPIYYWLKQNICNQPVGRHQNFLGGVIIALSFWTKFSVLIPWGLLFITTPFIALFQKNRSKIKIWLKDTLWVGIGALITSIAVILIFLPQNASWDMLQRYLLRSSSDRRISFALDHIFSGWISTMQNWLNPRILSPLGYLHLAIIVIGVIGFFAAKNLALRYKIMLTAVWLFSGLICNIYQPGATALVWTSFLVLFIIIGLQIVKPLFKKRMIISTSLCLALCFGLSISSFLNITDIGLAFPQGSETIQTQNKKMFNATTVSGNISVANYFCNHSRWYNKSQAILFTPGNAAVQTNNYYQQCGTPVNKISVMYQNKFYYGFNDPDQVPKIDRRILNEVSKTQAKQILFMFEKNPKVNKQLQHFLREGYKIKEIYQEKGPIYKNGGMLLIR